MNLNQLEVDFMISLIILLKGVLPNYLVPLGIACHIHKKWSKISELVSFSSSGRWLRNETTHDVITPSVLEWLVVENN